MSDNDSNGKITALLFIGGFIIFGLFFLLGFTFGLDSLKRDAVKNGVGYWEVKNDSGSTEFKWNTNK